MVDKSNEYGYVPESPTQARGSNTGVFEVNDVTDLLLAEQWSGDFGKLELIQTQTVSGTPNNVDFINLASNPYDVYFLTATNVQLNSDGYQILLRLSNDNGSSFIGGSSYDFANMRVSMNGTTNEYKNTATSFIASLKEREEITGRVSSIGD